jgi:hypothetical protein
MGLGEQTFSQAHTTYGGDCNTACVRTSTCPMACTIGCTTCCTFMSTCDMT